MTFAEAYTSLKQLYKQMMFPKVDFLPDGRMITKREWTMTEIDQLDVHFFSELMEVDDDAPQEQEVYLSSVWG
ncbi:hypothetical protein [Sporosarcina highlanderae]|uniref:Uncharacterized protein n=1 Tax=Sporosarcina highlanderae TaxID=3035916 RepID=A0ABT8JVE9_9BACL|nr:hypothetical protein [Sporosarcina highlanderae]MDN4609120.1 hypothetical protein [Sporosarcina highlanderae]